MDIRYQFPFTLLSAWKLTVKRNHNPIPPSIAGTLTPATCKLPYKFLPPRALTRLLTCPSSLGADPSSSLLAAYP